MIGEKIGRLTVIKIVPTGRRAGKLWRCHCACGSEVNVQESRLRFKTQRSCGCLRAKTKFSRKHGLARTPTHLIWVGMRKRCNDRNCSSWPRYGGRGIGYAREWDDFSVFLRDMGEKPEGMTLDRIDNNAGYSKENCRWTGVKQQARNRRSSAVYEGFGLSLTIAEWSERLGVPYGTLKCRLYRGHTIEHMGETVRAYNRSGGVHP